MSFTKLHSEILASSIWQEPHEVRLLWITMLAMSNQHGEVMASIPGLSHIARLTRTETENALKVLASPDPYSRTTDEEGRRLKPIDGGWFIINYAKHREKDSVDDRRAKDAERQRRHRARYKDVTENVINCDTSQNVTKSHAMQTQNAEANADTETEASCTESPSFVQSKAEAGPSLKTGATINPSDFEAKWKPDQRTKEQKLAKIEAPEDFPCERVFNDYLARTDSPIPEYKPELYQKLCRDKWHEWREDLGKWVKIRNWRRFVDGLGETIDGAKRGDR